MRTRAKPEWDPVTGQLSYEGEVIRRLRCQSVATRASAILQRFEERRWPLRIDSPFELNETKYDAIKSLNAGLKRLRFRPDGSGRGITWHVA